MSTGGTAQDPAGTSMAGVSQEAGLEFGFLSSKRDYIPLT